MEKVITLVVNSRQNFNLDDIGLDITDEGEIIIFPITENFNLLGCSIVQITNLTKNDKFKNK